MNALEWASAQVGYNPPDDVYCQTRDIVQSRIDKFKILFERSGWNKDQVVLITAVLGELAGNCFDHNLGQWRDVPGCWFEYSDMPKESFIAIIADRGQGILGSLRQVRPDLKTHNEALRLAFTEQISGRAPEKRGNGLKFVLRSLAKLSTRHFTFHSGDAMLDFAESFDIGSLDEYITDGKVMVYGTYAEISIAQAV